MPNEEYNLQLLSENLLNESDINKEIEIRNKVNQCLEKNALLQRAALSCVTSDVIKKFKERLEKRPDEFTNKDLLDSLTAMCQVSEKLSKDNSSGSPNTTITLNQQNNVVIESPNKLPVESRKRISDAILAITKQAAIESEELDKNNS